MLHFSITSEFIKLDSLLKAVGMVGTGGEAKLRIQQGEVMVNGEVCSMRGKKMHVGDVAAIGNESVTVE